MHLDQIRRRFEKLAREGLEYRMAAPAPVEAINEAETRLGVRFPPKVREFFGAMDGVEVAEPAFKVYPLAELTIDGGLLEFCVCDHVHRLAFDTSEMNEAEQWFIVNAETGYRITFTMASFWSIRMWSWIELGRPIWYDFHGEMSAE